MTVINGNYREYKLDNGLKVMLQNTSTQTIAVRLRVFFGSLNEKPGEKGLSHLLEHNLLSGGTTKYSPDEVDEIRSMFGSYNALTGLDSTIFTVDMVKEDFEPYLDYVSEVAFNLRLDSDRFEEERQRVLREIADDKSNPIFKDKKEYNDAIFGKDSPQSYYILGDEDVVGSVTLDELRVFHSRGYGTSNMDLILVGALPDNSDELIRKYFGNKIKGVNTRFKFPRNSPIVGRVIYHTSAPDLYNSDQPEESSAELNIALFGSTRSDPDFYAMRMLKNILGGDAHSRLFKRISQRMGLAYGIKCNYFHHFNAGVLYSGGSVKASKADEVTDAIFDEMRNLRENLIPERELDRHKRNLRYNMLKVFESNKGHLDTIQLIVDEGEGMTPESFTDKYNAITPKNIQDVALKYLPVSREEGNYVLMLRDPLKK